MMMLEDVRDYIASLDVAEHVYMGKLPDKEDKSVGVYNSKHQNVYHTALGGPSLEGYGEKYVTILMHWNKSPRDTEKLNSGLAAIENAFSFSYDFKNPITGTRHYGHYGMSLPRVPTIPHLAQGAYVKPNTPQLAMIGDNLHQGEVVAPENKLREMAIEAVRAAGGSGITREDLETIMNRAVMRIIAALSQMGFYLDGKKLAEAENAVKAEIDRRFNTVDIK